MYESVASDNIYKDKGIQENDSKRIIMKKILIIGGSGFIGTNLSKQLLLERDYEIYSLDLQVPQVIDGRIHYICGSFFDDELIHDLISDKDYIVHAISTINPGNSNEKYIQGYERDFIYTMRLCSHLIGKSTKMIFLSSGGTIYGNHEKQLLDEEILPRPINHYGNIKLCIENTLRVFNYQMHNKMIIARISNPYGIGQDFHKGVGFIDAVLKRCINGEEIEIWGDGNNIRDYIYIEDVCKMIIRLLNYEGKYDTFNISSGIGVSQNEIVDIVRGMGLKPQVIYKPQRTVDVRKIILDNSRIREIYKEEMMPLKQGIKKYCEYLLKTKMETGNY